ncbi:hypothetical protein DL93DRAFT_2091409 [Clavulina sp. PMI_390]|nr:hypothetical protein DL93DRAFT_2091409 [Clavulina sp. PMI_390]
MRSSPKVYIIDRVDEGRTRNILDIRTGTIENDAEQQSMSTAETLESKGNSPQNKRTATPKSPTAPFQ